MRWKVIRLAVALAGAIPPEAQTAADGQVRTRLPVKGAEEEDRACEAGTAQEALAVVSGSPDDRKYYESMKAAVDTAPRDTWNIPGDLTARSE